MEHLLNRITQGDCLEVMKEIPDKSVDMILCDLPYGTTKCKWDTIIPFKPLWSQYERIVKGDGAIVLTASQPFSSALVMSNPELFKYSWVWDKVKPTGFQMANYRPLKSHEDILIFSKAPATFVKNKPSMKYNPQGVFDLERVIKATKRSIAANNGGDTTKTYVGKKSGFPKSILEIYNNDKNRVHEAQKPVELFEYLIKTYTNEGEVVLDNCIGSGTTAIAALNTGRFFIGIEKEPEYVEIANKRIEAVMADDKQRKNP